MSIAYSQCHLDIATVLTGKFIIFIILLLLLLLFNFTGAVKRERKRGMKTDREPEGHVTKHELHARVNE